MKLFSNSFSLEEKPSLLQCWQKWRSLVGPNYLLGLACLCGSAGWFLIVDSWKTNKEGYFSAFCLNYAIAISYSFYLFSVKDMKVFWKRQPSHSIPHRLLNWWLWIISCFALNRYLPAFQQATTWLEIVLVASAALSIVYSTLPLLPNRLKWAFYVGWGSSFFLWLYFAVYLLPTYPLSTLGILFLGLGFHSFVPLFLVASHLKIIYQGFLSYRPQPIVWGLMAPIFCIGLMIFQWSLTTYRLNNLYTTTELNTSDELPNWTKLAQQIDKSWITERILKSGLVYHTPTNNYDFTPSSNRFEGIRYHDPIVVLGAWWTSLEVSSNERIKILETLYDARHDAQERIWTGSDLQTNQVITNTRIYPSYRLAYTEKTLSIQNVSPNSWQQEEAIYTFYLPEGSVVSALSLWIGEREEKGYLTTTTKADSAYKTVVGVERRDPSVVHWQEGNTVKVRVFPCTPRENRRFKIGITSPLKIEGNNLVYHNIHFKGPSTLHTPETIRVELTEKVEGWQGLWPLNQHLMVSYQGNYTPAWVLKFIAPSLSPNKFIFQQKAYQLAPYRPSLALFLPNNIYLDINEAWQQSDFEKICQLFNYKNLWVYDNEMISISPQNAGEVFKRLSQYRFSLFPIYRITNPTQSLLITAGTFNAPTLQDIKGSVFAQNLTKKAAHLPSIPTVCLNNILSPYVKTLHELRLLTVVHSSTNKLEVLIKKRQFRIPKTSETPLVALVESAQMIIKEEPYLAHSSASKTLQAPDHLLRLYAYNHLLQQIGGKYFQKENLADTLIAEAAQAHIVSPISSLVVLETQADYERFDLKKLINSLDNAALKKSGAIPEPHEWALVILLICLIVYAWIRPNGNLF